MKLSTLFTASLPLAASLVSASVVPQQALDVAGQALAWTDQFHDDDLHAATVWSYTDCGGSPWNIRGMT